MIHLDLFSGIGGFAIAAEQVWPGIEHIFCDNDKFCQEVLKKHWPEAKIYDDIRKIKDPLPADIVTGGFPCQPFSQAGQRKGTADDRYLWPEMLRVIRLAQPEWVIAENVSGLLTMQGGVVFEQVCTSLEAAGYDVQPFIIPAAGVAAPHKRDRVWICAHANRPEHRGGGREGEKENSISSLDRPAVLPRQPGRADQADAGATKDAGSQRSRGRRDGDPERHDRQVQNARPGSSRAGWEREWLEVAAELCSLDDGLPARVGGRELSKGAHRNQQIKAYGNAIVPQVAAEIMMGMIA